MLENRYIGLDWDFKAWKQEEVEEKERNRQEKVEEKELIRQEETEEKTEEETEEDKEEDNEEDQGSTSTQVYLNYWISAYVTDATKTPTFQYWFWPDPCTVRCPNEDLIKACKEINI